MERQYLGHNTWCGLKHDVDKLILILFTRKNVEEIHDIHVSRSNHHFNSRAKCYNDYVEMFIDWECARLTKPDKPYDAMGALYKFYSEHIDTLEPIFKNLIYNKSKNRN